MPNLRTLAVRLKSVKNIQKITQSMKVVSVAKYARAQRELKLARPLGHGARRFYEKAEIAPLEDLPMKVLIAVTSDKGLCGSVHANVARYIRREMEYDRQHYKIVCVGEKSKQILKYEHAPNIIMSCYDVGRRPPTFLDASRVADAIINSEYAFGSGKIVYNECRSIISYKTETIPIFCSAAIKSAPKVSAYDNLDDEVIQSYLEFSIAAMLFYALKEGACSELSARITAMQSASKNAGEFIQKLAITYNHTRQAAITKELIEIISGAMAVDQK